MRLVTIIATAAVLLAPLVALMPSAAAANDAGSGTDAGNTFATATLVSPTGRYSGSLTTGDQDWYRFHVAMGQQIDIDVSAGLITGAIQVNDAGRRLGVMLYDPNGVPLDNPITNVGDARVTWPKAHVEGEYRLQLDAARLGARSYSFCFVVTGDTCASLGLRPMGLLTPLPVTHAEVLLVPPTAIDPTAPVLPTEYLDAALAGIRAWDPAIDQFTAKYPQYDYLQRLKAHVEIFDGAPQRAGYDVIIVWAPYTGPVFRGLAADFFGGGVFCRGMCSAPGIGSLEPYVHDGTRLIIMSSFAAAPRGGQVMPDFPEPSDVYNVMQHEFAHTWGLGHTLTWTAEHGPDLMNSPYGHVFGNGDVLGDGGERTPWQCISSLDLYGMAFLYEWLGRNVPWHQRLRASSVTLPADMPYEMMCAPGP